MKKGKSIKITSVSQFVKKIAQLKKKEGAEIFYRGHANQAWDLLPSIFRVDKALEKEHLLFRDMVAHTPRSFAECKSALDYLVQMQHYELPTRLLDVTMNPLVALYFACLPLDEDQFLGVKLGAKTALEMLGNATRHISFFLEVVQFALNLYSEPSEDVKTHIQTILSDLDVAGHPDDLQSSAQSLAGSLSKEDLEDLCEKISGGNFLSTVEAFAKLSNMSGLSLDPDEIGLASATCVLAVNAQVLAAGKKSEGVPPLDTDKIVAMAGALAATDAGEGAAVAMAQAIADDEFAIDDAKDACGIIALIAARAGAQAGARARKKDGVVYLFSIPEHKMRYYDSDTVSVLANIAKCKSEDIDLNLYAPREENISFYDEIQPIINNKEAHWKRARRHEMAYHGQAKSHYQSEQWISKLWGDIVSENPAHEVGSTYLEWLNKERSIQPLLYQIRGEKPHFQPLIQACELINIFLVKAKNDNPRITNQAGAFLLFGLGLYSGNSPDGEVLRCRKDNPAEIPSAWIAHQFRVPAGKKQDILDELARMGITESYLFPEMDKYAKELQKKYRGNPK